MKKLIICALGVIAATGISFAKPANLVSAKDFKQPAASTQFFNDTEFAIDAFYSYNNAVAKYPQKASETITTYSVADDFFPRETTKNYITHPQYFTDGSGGGVGANFFFLRYLGVSLEGNWWKGTSDGITFEDFTRRIDQGKGIPSHYGKDIASQVTANLIVRYPIEFTCFGLAPYIFGGGGAVFGDQSCGFPDVGGGVEVRLTPHFGVFSDWRWNFMTGGNRNDVTTTRAGIRFVF